ncbi:MAG: hypothetical protein EB145_08675 [Proteobacteria bacterium]|nr:hypothetical protein [Pseudomonadota bacterium]
MRVTVNTYMKDVLFQRYQCAEALNPFTWMRYLEGSSWKAPVDLQTWSRAFARDVGKPLQSVTSDPGDVVIGLLLVVLADLRAITADPEGKESSRGATWHPDRRIALPVETASMAETIVRAAMVACEARPRWARAIMTGQRTMAELFGLIARRLDGSPYLGKLGNEWDFNHQFYHPGVYDEATLSMLEAGMVTEMAWRGMESFVVVTNNRWARDKDPWNWAVGDRFTFPVKDTVTRAHTLSTQVGQGIVKQLRSLGLTEAEWPDDTHVSTAVKTLHNAVADVRGYKERDKRAVRQRIRAAFDTLMDTWSRHMKSAAVRMDRRGITVYWPREVLVVRQSLTREDVTADPLQALATIRALRTDVAARVQAARDLATEIEAAYREWVASQQAWLVVSGQVLDPVVKGGS